MTGPTGIWTKEAAAHNGYPVSAILARKLTEILDSKKLVIDFGCGNCYYLDGLCTSGFTSLLGIDGYVPAHLDKREYMVVKRDLSQPHVLPLKGQVICLEVGEHIPIEFEETFLDNICNHCSCRMVLSWALPGQGGVGHVNCRGNDYVISQVQRRGFKLNKKLTAYLREEMEMPVKYFQDTVMVFDKI